LERVRRAKIYIKQLRIKKRCVGKRKEARRSTAQRRIVRSRVVKVEESCGNSGRGVEAKVREKISSEGRRILLRIKR